MYTSSLLFDFRCGLINAAVIDYFIGDCVIFNHFELIKHYIMLYDGGFTDSLCTILFEEVRGID